MDTDTMTVDQTISLEDQARDEQNRMLREQDRAQRASQEVAERMAEARAAAQMPSPPRPVQLDATGSVNRAAAIRAAKRKNPVFLLMFTTDEPFPVEVTLPDIGTLIGNGTIPSSSRALVNELVRQTGVSGSKQSANVADKFFQDDPIQAVRSYTDIVNATVMAGFVKPRVVMEEDQITDQDTQLWIGEIDSRDRIRYFQWVNNFQEAEAEATKSGTGGDAGPDPLESLPASQGVSGDGESSGYPVGAATPQPVARTYFDPVGNRVDQFGHPL